MNNTCRKIVAAFAALAAKVAVAAVPFQDGFETYPGGTALATAGQNGWTASDVAVVVSNAAAAHVYAGTNALCVGRGASLTNRPGGSAQAVWTDLRIQPVLGNLPDALIESNLSVKVAFMTNGVLAVLGTNGWDNCSNDVRGAVATNAVAGQWARVTIRKDYVNRLATVFLNGQCLRQSIPMTGTSTVFSCVAWGAAGGDGWLDEVGFSNGVPAGATSDMTDVGRYGYVTLTRTVGVGQAYATVSNAVAAARTGDRILVVPGTTLAEGVVTTRVDSTVYVGSNSVLTFAALAVGSNGTVIVSNAAVTVTSLTVGQGGWFQVVNGTATVNGVTQTGSFRWGTDWQNQVAPSDLPFSDGFEAYGNGMLLAYLSGAGWSMGGMLTLYDGLVTNGVAHAPSANSLYLVSGVTAVQTVTNPVAGEKLWTDVWLKPVLGLAPTVGGTETFKAYFTSNGYLAVYSGGAWDVCSNDVVNGAVPAIGAGDWARLTVFQDYGAQTFAVCVNGTVVRQGLGFLKAASRYSRLEAGVSGGAWFLDDVAISNGVPADLTVAATAGHDLDSDGVADAVEVSRYGSLTLWPKGSVFKIR